MPLRTFVALILCAVAFASAPLRAAETVSPLDREAIEKIVHDYLIQHPEVLIEAMKSADDKLKADQAAETRAAVHAKQDELLHDPSTPTGGNPNGNVTIVEFFDYRCPYCKQVEPDIEALLKEDPKLRIVYKEFPILGPDSVTASRVALAALKQGADKYARFHSAMMNTKGQINEAVIMKVAADSGLDMARIKSDMKGPEIDAAIKRTYALADALNINGTPAILIGDTLTPGVVDLTGLRQLIADARKSG
jgi:protein-disulfide isomerase